MHNQGLEQNFDLMQQHITPQRALDLIREEIKKYPISSLLSYIQPFELKCRVSKYGMSMILYIMVGYEFSIMPYHETAYF